MICFKVEKIRSLTLERLSLAVATLLAKTCIPTVSKHDGELTKMPSGGFTGTTENPSGKIGILEGSLPFIASLTALTSTVE